MILNVFCLILTAIYALLDFLVLESSAKDFCFVRVHMKIQPIAVQEKL